MRPPRVEPLKEALPFVLGLARIRGGAVTIIDTGLLASGQAIGSPRRLVTIRVEGQTCMALAVDEVEGVVELSHAEDLPPLVQNDVLSGVAFAGDSLVLVLRAARLVEKAGG